MFPAFFYPANSTCELSFSRPILFPRISLSFSFFLLSLQHNNIHEEQSSLSFIIEPNLDSCPVEVVQLGKLFYNTLR